MSPGAPSPGSPWVSREGPGLALTLPVLGVPVRLRSDDAATLQAFREAFGTWPGPAAVEALPGSTPTGVVEGRLVLAPGEVDRGEGDPAGGPVAVSYRVGEGGRLTVRAADSVAVADPGRRAFSGRISRALLEDREHFREKVLEALVLAVVTWLDRTPLHAAAVVRGGTALVLAGPSGRGKSTLALAAARAGLRVLSDEIVFVQLDPRLRVWGLAGPLHVAADAPGARDLAAAGGRSRSDGKMRISLAGLAAVPEAPVAERVGVCVLERGPGEEPTVEALPPGALERALARVPLEPGFDLFAHVAGDVARALGARPGWRLRTGTRPERTAALLPALLDEVERKANGGSRGPGSPPS